MSLKDIHNCDYVVLLCENMKETRAFYENVMGFPIEHDSENWVSFKVGATLLTLRPRGPSPAGDDGAAAPGSAEVQLAFRVPPPAVDACHAELVAKGVPIARAPTDLPAWRHCTLYLPRSRRQRYRDLCRVLRRRHRQSETVRTPVFE